jgi:hypothetical protein
MPEKESQESQTTHKIQAEVVSVSSLTPTEQAVTDAVQGLFQHSLTASSDYIKFMVPVCSAEIPAYAALLKFISASSCGCHSLQISEALVALVPAFLLIITLAYFAYELSPRILTTRATIDTARGANTLYREIVARRQKVHKLGTLLFSIANASMVLVLVALLAM